MADRGQMDISEHRETYSDFLKFTKWSIISVASILIILALTVA